MDAPHETLRRFGYPQSEVAAYEHWSVLVRPEQVTACSLVLCARSDVTRFGALPDGAHQELARTTADIESALDAAVSFEKINYLMLMMVDPQVHFHVFPRYEGTRTVCEMTFADAGWPRAPAMAEPTALDDAGLAALVSHLRGLWPG